MALLCCPDVSCDGAVCIQVAGSLEAELPTIRRAAVRNRCFGDDFIILLAIRRAENGRAGRQFGVMHPAALDTDLDTQAGWAAATIVSNRKRWVEEQGVFTGKAGGQRRAGASGPDFIDFLADKYCPAEIDPTGNVNWKINVRYWYEKLKNNKRQGCYDSRYEPGGFRTKQR